MLLVDQYIHSVSKYLHVKGKNDILKEVKANLLDDIEGSCGLEASDEEIFVRIKAFGTPRELAKSYNSNQGVISEGISDLYFLILKLVAFALSIAFVAIYFVQVVFVGENPVKEAISVPFNILSSYFGAVGIITLIFIGISRLDIEDVNLDDWDLRELKSVEIGEAKESRVGSTIALIFLFVFAAIFLFRPESILAVEEGFMIAGIIERYSLVVEVFRFYAPFIVFSFLFDILYHILAMIHGERTKTMVNIQMVGNLYSVVVLAIMLLDSNLFIDNGFFISVKTVFAVIFSINLIELIVMVYKRLTRNKVSI